MMQAILHERYGPPEVALRLAETTAPKPGPGEVLVDVRATSLHPDIWHVVTGQPWALRLMGAGLLAPKVQVPGTDAAGVVAEAGPGVDGLAPGDRVVGDLVDGFQWHSGGGLAEQVVASADTLRPVADGLGFHEAASLVTSGALAVQVVRDEGQVEAGDRVLLNGAGGSLGVTAVQLACHMGCQVTAVDAAHKLDTLTRLGADQVLDYREHDVNQLDEAFDVVIDIASTFTVGGLKQVTGDGGRYVLVGHHHYGQGPNRWIGGIGRFAKLAVLSPFVDALPRPGITRDPGDRLDWLLALAVAGKLSPMVDRVLPLEETVAGLGYLASGEPIGQVVVDPS